MIPPWAKHPEIPFGSIQWRMGVGEDYAAQFDEWFGSLSPAAKAQYVTENPPPDGWTRFYQIREYLSGERFIPD